MATIWGATTLTSPLLLLPLRAVAGSGAAADAASEAAAVAVTLRHRYLVAHWLALILGCGDEGVVKSCWKNSDVSRRLLSWGPHSSERRVTRVEIWW